MKKIHHEAFLLLLCAAALTGCAGMYGDYYQPVEGMTPEKIASLRASPPNNPPLIEKGDQLNERGLPVNAVSKPGFIEIGSSFFSGGSPNWTITPGSPTEVAKKIGADLAIVFSPRFKGNVSCETAICNPDPDSLTGLNCYYYWTECSTYYYGAIFYIKQKN
ncbi:MAG: hypothetical protein FWF41_01400 [Betaproteobacteria bacterium]|nr:hypothetical protein [Betaproteobacteria bacterium]